MRPARNLFEEEELIHIYQNTINGSLLFYSISDYLVLLSLISVAARSCGISVICLCIMIDHIHLLIHVADRKTLERFVMLYTSPFVRLYNTSSGRSGPLFHSPFGWSVKTGFKKIRTAIAYNLNNPVEKKLCKKAEEYPWNFLAYGSSSHPFSLPLVKSHASQPLRKACRIIDAFYNRGEAINYALLQTISPKLDNEEKKQLTDYVIRKYNPIDYKSLIGYYGSISSLLTAVHSNTGSEYDIREDTLGGDDTAYRRITAFFLKEGIFDNLKCIPGLPEGERRKLLSLILTHVPAIKKKQAAKYLHLPFP